MKMERFSATCGVQTVHLTQPGLDRSIDRLSVSVHTRLLILMASRVRLLQTLIGCWRGNLRRSLPTRRVYKPLSVVTAAAAAPTRGARHCRSSTSERRGDEINAHPLWAETWDIWWLIR